MSGTLLLDLFRVAKGAALRMRGAEEDRVRVGAADLLVYRLGPPAGEPWVLLHGLAATSLSWLPVLPGLRRDCRLVLPELAGLGGSEVPGGGLAVADGVATVTELIEREFGGRPVTLGGNSLGGWTAVRLALARPDLVSRLVLVSAGGYRDQDWEHIREVITVRDRSDVETLLRALFGRLPLSARLGRRGVQQAFSAPAVASILSRLREEDAFGDDELARLDLPAALVWGERDGLFTLEVARRMAAALPRATLYPLAGCGHALQWERPFALAAAVEDFRAKSDDLFDRSDAA